MRTAVQDMRAKPVGQDVQGMECNLSWQQGRKDNGVAEGEERSQRGKKKTR